jgi:hypothetical protein
MGLTGRSSLGQGIRVLEAVIPSEVEAATQPRNPSGQGQAFHPAVPSGNSARSVDFAALRSGWRRGH